MGRTYQEVFEELDPPFEDWDDSLLTDDFGAELQTASRLWVSTGYGQGIAAYLNFFLLTDFIVTHDEAHPPRFMSFKSMADSFYQTDLFIRDVTDSGKEPNGGISNPKVRELFDIPEEYAVCAMLPIGKPVKQLTRLRRKAVDEFATVDSFAGPTLP